MEEGEPQTIQSEEQSQTEKWYTPLTHITSLSKYLAMVLFIVLPFVGFWLGMEYGASTQSDTATYDQEVILALPSIEKGTVVTQDGISEVFPSCGFSEKELVTIQGEVPEKQFEYYFKLAVPDSVEVIQVERSQENYIVKDKNSNYTATINVHHLDRDVLVARRLHSPSLRYEPVSDVWWTMPQHDGEKMTQCDVGAPQITLTGDPIYITGDGDVGAFFTNYTVVFQEWSSMQGKAIQFHISADSNDANFNTFSSFSSVLQQMIQTVEPKINKG